MAGVGARPTETAAAKAETIGGEVVEAEAVGAEGGGGTGIAAGWTAVAGGIGEEEVIETGGASCGCIAGEAPSPTGEAGVIPEEIVYIASSAGSFIADIAIRWAG